MQALRIGDFIGVRYNIARHADDFEIYNVMTDPKEAVNVAPAHAALQQQMKDTVLQVRRPGGGVTRPYDGELVPGVEPGLVVSNRLDFALFEGVWPWVPDFERLTPVASGRMNGLDLGVRTRESNYGFRISGYFIAPTNGAYTFHLACDAGAEVRMHEALLFDDDFGRAGSELSAMIQLKAGLHPIRIYYRHASGTPRLRLEYSGPGIARRPVPPEAFCVRR
jgi:hypothetical protein